MSEQLSEPSSGLSKFIAKGGCCFPHGGLASKLSLLEQMLEVKIARARRAGPYQITKDATVAEWNYLDQGPYRVLREGSPDNHWICFPGNENVTGDVPLAADPAGMEWLTSILKNKPAPTNIVPGLVFMLCGATQHSNTDPFDHDSKAIPIGPHYMICWPFDSKRDGMPSNVRDAGAWVMFDGTPFAYLHVCGSPWEGTSYHPESACAPIWTMKYAQPSDENEKSRSFY